MTHRVEFIFDFGSPNAYLSHLAIPQIEARTGVQFEYVPVLLGGVFKATNNVSPAVSLQGIKNKPEFQRIVTERFLARYNVPNYQPNPHFPVNTLMIMRGAIVAQKEGFYASYIDAMYQHMWAEPKKMDDPEVVQAAFESSGLPVQTLLDGIQDPANKQQLITNTEQAVARGVFGSPSFFVDDELYFGKDQLRDVEEAL